LGRRLSEWERLDRKAKVSKRDLAAAEREVEKLVRQIEMIDTHQLATTDRDYFARKHSTALVKVRSLRERADAAEAELAAYEASMARFREEEPAPTPEECLQGDELAGAVAEAKRLAEENAHRRLGRPA